MIRARSPYIVHVDDSGLEAINFNIYVYSGNRSTDKASGDLYEFSIDAVNGEVTFDASPYIRQSLGSSLNPTTNDNLMWVAMDIDKDTGAGLSGSFSAYQTTRTAGMGWSIPEDGLNYDDDLNILSFKDSDNDVIKRFGDTGFMAVKSNSTIGAVEYEVIFYDGYNQTGTADTPVVVTTADILQSGEQYAHVTIPANAKSYKYWINDGSIPSAERTGNIYEVGDCKNDPVRVDFINSNGIRDTVWFTGRAVESYNTSQNSYKKSILNSGAYNQYDRQQTVFNKMAKREVRLNSGFYRESFNDLFRELLLSDHIWLVDGTYKPLTIKDSSLEYKYSLYEKTINYEITFEYANDHLNSIK